MLRRVAVLLLSINAIYAEAALPQRSEVHKRGRDAKLDTIDLFFSGGGIRAAFGTLIAMCETLNYWHTTPSFRVKNIIGLSGGAWGVSLLGAAKNLSACDLLTRATSLPSWGEVSAFRNIKCDTETTTRRESCFRGWRHDIGRWFEELLSMDVKQSVDADLESTDADMHVPPGFGRHKFNKSFSRVWIQTDPCTFTEGSSHVAEGHGACIASANDGHLYCIGDKNKTQIAKDGIQTSWNLCQAHDGVPVPVTYNHLLAWSSAAWASASAVSLGFKSLLWTRIVKDKRSPEIECPGMRTPLCDAGGECNLPLGALDVLFLRPSFDLLEMPPLKQFIVFDYSDNGGNMKKSIHQCLNKWKKVSDWALLNSTNTSWGYALHMKGTEASAHPEFILHVVVFRGDNNRPLVTELPTINMRKFANPTPLTPAKAALIRDEYSQFLKRTLFGAPRNPFNTRPSEWLAMMRRREVKSQQIEC